ncbi:MAG: glycosyltransferase [Anaerolineae bacterium]
MIRPEILIVSHDIVAAQMAGPGIRYRGLARVLARSFNVTLAVPGDSDLDDEPFALWPYRRDEWATLAPAAHRARVIIAPGDSLADFAALEGLPGPLVVDGYDPHTLETLAMWRGEAPAFQDVQHGARLEILRRQCRAADFLICASERQRDWWLGQMEQAGRINPRTYGADPSLRSLVDVVGFGLPAEPPQARRPVIRGVWPGVGTADELLLWGGGLWQWLDPLTALRAVRRLVDGGRDRVRLVFPGTRHPNPNVPHMSMHEQAMALAEELGLAGVHVFFGDWVPFQDWPSVLLEADVGLSLHPDTVEARLAFRCRVLDYVWAGLPSVLTRGDATAELVAGRGLGTLVDFGDDAAVANGIAALLDRPLPEARFEAARRELTWEQAAAPLVSFCRQPHRAADRGRGSAMQPGAPVRATPGAVTPREEDERGTTMPKPASNISVIVLTWNGQDYIVDCLEALLAQDPAPLELIVVDNASTDGTPDLVAQRFPQVTLIRNQRNLGFAAGNNVGLRAATGQTLVLLNQDTQAHSGFLAAMAEAMEEPGVGLAGCKLLYPDGTIQHAGGFVYGPRGEPEHVGCGAPDDGRFDERTEPDFVTAAAVAISRACLAEIGPLDEGFAPAYYEDVDWCYRARAAGWRVVYEPRAVVTHHEGASADRISYGYVLSVNHGRVRFLLKHWPLKRLLEEWRPAEAAWVAELPRVTWLMAARGAYLQALLDLPGILALRHGSAQEALALADLLGDLRAAALTSLEALPQASSLAAIHPLEPPAAPEPDASEPEAPQPAPEQPTPAAQPRPGRLLDRLCRLWAALRHLDVLPDLVRHVQQHDDTLAEQGQALVQHGQALAQQGQAQVQQGQAQVQQGEFLGWISRRVDGLETRSTAQGDVLAGQARDVAQNIRELTAIAEQLARLEALSREDRKGG